MNKQFEYRGYNFNIRVDLNTKIERRPNGRRWHTITINCIDDQDYNKTAEVEDAFLEVFIGNIEYTAKEFIDNKEDGKKKNLDEQRLIKLGFE